MAWIGLLIALYLVLGLRDHTRADSTHLTILVVTIVVLAMVFVLPGTFT
jgi:hypothetical protein